MAATVEGVRLALAGERLSKHQRFDVLRDLAILVNRDGENPQVHELVLRACEYRARFGAAAPILDALVRQRGLFPYLNQETLGFQDRLALGMHTPDGMGGIVFHRVQAEVYEALRDGLSVVLSAPTSFGKSLIIDAVLAAGDHRLAVVVVPTLALMDETRRRLVDRFRGERTVITQADQAKGDKTILVATPERVVEMEGLRETQFFALDEFYKLDPAQDAERSPAMNEAFYRLLKTGAQFYLLGPNIRDIPKELRERDKVRFIHTDFATVATEVLDRRVARRDRYDALGQLVGELDEPTLIYCAGPDSARRALHAVLAAGMSAPHRAVESAAAWAAEEFHPEWKLVEGLRNGIGLHHGKLPRALAQYMVRAFNNKCLRFLVCTSTLIEGVNTRAKNVVVVDNTIGAGRFDYFTFSNIKGRSGRMREHFVGRVFLLAEPPAEPELPAVDMPAMTQGKGASDALLLQLDQKDLSEESRARLAGYFEQELVPVPVLRMNRGIDPARQLKLAAAIQQAPDDHWRFLAWSGAPTSEQLYHCTELIWEFLIPEGGHEHGARSGRQLAFQIDRMRSTKNIKALIEAELTGEPERRAVSPDEAVEGTLEFIRYWAGYHFPRYLMALGRIQEVVFSSLNLPVGDYTLFAADIESSFVSPGIARLEEYGIPLQAAKRLEQALGSPVTLDDALAALRRLDLGGVTLPPFERELVEDAREHL